MNTFTLQEQQRRVREKQEAIAMYEAKVQVCRYD